MMPDKGLHRILLGFRRRPSREVVQTPLLAEEDLRAISDLMIESLHLDAGVPAVRGSENHDDGARQGIRAGRSYVRGDSARGRRMRELANKVEAGEISTAEYARLINEATRLSPQ